CPISSSRKPRWRTPSMGPPRRGSTEGSRCNNFIGVASCRSKMSVELHRPVPVPRNGGACTGVEPLVNRNRKAGLGAGQHAVGQIGRNARDDGALLAVGVEIRKLDEAVQELQID